MNFKLFFLFFLSSCINKVHGTGLHKAVEQGNLDKIRVLLEHRPDPNSLDERGYAPLHYGAMHNSSEYLELLLNHNAFVNIASRYGMTPLHFAAAMGIVNNVKFLLSRGAWIDAKDISLKTPLYYAAMCKKIEAVAVLLDCGAYTSISLDPIREESIKKLIVSHTKLIGAAYCDLGLTDQLLSQGVFQTPFAKKRYELNETLLTSVDADDLLGVQHFLEQGANINVKDREGNTPLHLAVKRANVTITKLLLSLGALTDISNAQGDLAIHFATSRALLNLFL